MPSTDATTSLLDALGSALADWSAVSPWGVAISGGRDSSVLLWALCRLVGSERLQGLYVDHGWRPSAERSLEAASVARWSARLGVKLLSFSPPEGGVASEDSARAHRYQCFRSFLDRHPGSPVFLAHHADDQAETILMRLLRGRSWQGLGGMVPRRGAFVRPFLGLSSSVLAEVAVQHEIPFFQDSSNFDDRPTRNFLRLRVFPLMKERFPGLVPALTGLADAWRQMLPAVEADSAWNFGLNGASIGTTIWDGWNGIVRQAQLLAVATRIQAGVRLSRRFLEGVVSAGRQKKLQGAGWIWRRSNGLVRWERVVQPATMEYFVMADPGVTYDLGAYRLSWTKVSPEPRPSGTFFVSGIDPDQALIWRSVVSGMVLSSVEDQDWDREKKRKRLGSFSPARCALLLQGSFLRAVIDPSEKTVSWAETGEEKLNNTGIFVTLV